MPQQKLQVTQLSHQVGSASIPVLHQLTVSATAGEFVLILGPSGSGKTSLAHLIAGISQPSVGTVHLNGKNVSELAGNGGVDIGFVPQEDIVHNALSVEQALEFAAHIRMRTSLGKEGARQRAHSVMHLLELDKVAHRRISLLSGGERKRVSLALELLAEPELLVLDEPTTGLDPALDDLFMRYLRILADSGRIIVAVTHKVTNVNIADQILVLNSEGSQLYQGPPEQIFDTLGVKDWPGVFALASGHEPPGVGEPVGSAQTPIPEATDTSHAGTNTAPSTAPVLQPSGWFATFTSQVSRGIALLSADRGYTLFLLCLPFVVAGLTIMVPGLKGLRSPNATEILEASQVLVLIIFGASFMGLALTIRELIAERPIFQREHFNGLPISSYLAAKLTLLAAISAGQCLVLLLLVALVKPSPAFSIIPTTPWAGIFVAAWGTALASGTLGLLISALLSSQAQVMPVLVVISMLQLVFSGGLIPVFARFPLDLMAMVVPGRWGFAAAASSINLRTISPSTIQDPLWEHGPAQYWMNCAVLLGCTILALSVTWWRLSRGYGGRSTPAHGSR